MMTVSVTMTVTLPRHHLLCSTVFHEILQGCIENIKKIILLKFSYTRRVYILHFIILAPQIRLQILSFDFISITRHTSNIIHFTFLNTCFV